MSPLLLDRYLSAASKISRIAVGDTATPTQFQTYDVPRTLEQNDRTLHRARTLSARTA